MCFYLETKFVYNECMALCLFLVTQSNSVKKIIQGLSLCILFFTVKSISVQKDLITVFIADALI